MHQISSTMNSFTLSWPQPEQPNGIILDYELRYYEKVRYVCVRVCVEMFMSYLASICNSTSPLSY